MTDLEILEATAAAYDNGLVVEPSGAAALAAVMKQKIKKCGDEEKLVIVLTGGNVSAEDLCNHIGNIRKNKGFL